MRITAFFTPRHYMLIGLCYHSFFAYYRIFHAMALHAYQAVFAYSVFTAYHTAFEQTLHIHSIAHFWHIIPDHRTIF